MEEDMNKDLSLLEKLELDRPKLEYSSSEDSYEEGIHKPCAKDRKRLETEESEPISWAAEVEEYENEQEELQILEKSIPTETDPIEERREYMKDLLKAMQVVGVFFHGVMDLNLEDKALLQQELDGSLEDLMEMLAYTDANMPPDPKKLRREQARGVLGSNRFQTNKLKVVSWDLGMLCYQYMGTRAKAIVDLILKEKLDVVFLQEVNPLVSSYLISRLFEKYEFRRGRKLTGRFMDYTLTLVRIETAVVLNSNIVYYPNTRERRTLLKTEIQVGGVKFCLMNTHLESLLGNSKYRMAQLQKCFDICGSLPSDFNVIFCGSLNIREWEIKKLKIPKNLMDIWERFGDEKSKFTWDLRVTKLIQMPVSGLATTEGSKLQPPSASQPQKRFSRMYFRPAKQALIHPISFGLTGMEIVAVNKYHSSDHWALVSNFRIPSGVYEMRQVVKEEEMPTKFDPTADLLDGEDGKTVKEVVQEVVKDSWDDSD